MQPASFSFDRYRITEFQFVSQNLDESAISLKIEPFGQFITSSKNFILRFDFFAFGEERDFNDSFIKCSLEAEFKLSDGIDKLNDIPSYFYTNSIAIVFPYLRAFISSLTVQANVRPVILPIMNLTALSEELKDKSEII